jgi:hypothetical protein
MKEILVFLFFLIQAFSAKYDYNRILNKNYKSDIELHFQSEHEFSKNQTVIFIFHNFRIICQYAGTTTNLKKQN